MPFEVRKIGEKYKLWKIKEKEYANKEFNSRESAISMAKTWMRYRKEDPYVKGNKILDR